ncbi:GNAT family N-acetyltransferase [Streptomyces sp. SID10853]|uniref:GNAT family N-acetyltransferase n=1 Tax=Streptomyces sp. SID10853 TaxID=2706028 RepID=UPI0013BEF78C|nr:GNAT family N-acetyltransferase [Streptomyces sp. SID10853]NDZ79050.1 GNAT family N-acetyltransferase [Streptomyces sp. SID10853]
MPRGRPAPQGTAGFVELHADPRGNRFVGRFSQQQVLRWLAEVEQQWAARGHGLCALELRSSGEFIGRSGLQYWQQFDEIELGWTLKAEQWGRGYATEAARAGLDWGLANLEADYFTALMKPGNFPSVKAAERLGFSPRRQDGLNGSSVTVYALNRPALSSERQSG